MRGFRLIGPRFGLGHVSPPLVLPRPAELLSVCSMSVLTPIYVFLWLFFSWQVMPAINRLLRGGDSEVLSHACSTLSHLCDGSAAHIKVCDYLF